MSWLWVNCEFIVRWLRRLLQCLYFSITHMANWQLLNCSILESCRCETFLTKWTWGLFSNKSSSYSFCFVAPVIIPLRRLLFLFLRWFSLSLLMALKYSTSLSTPCRSSSSYCSSYSSSVSCIYCHSSSSSSSSSSSPASSASGHVFFSLCFVLILFVLTSHRCSCHYSSSSSSVFLLDDSSYHYCWCDLYCQWKIKAWFYAVEVTLSEEPPSPPASMFPGQLGRGSGSLKYCQSNIDSGGWRGAMLRVKIKDPWQASCCPSCNWQNRSHQQSPLLIFSNTSPARRSMSSVLITFWENGKPIELRL